MKTIATVLSPCAPCRPVEVVPNDTESAARLVGEAAVGTEAGAESMRSEPWWRRSLRDKTYPYRTIFTTWRILTRDFGHGRSAFRRESVDAQGREIPWYSYPAIEYLQQLDFREKSVFEFGCGNSTVYWARHAARVVSVESKRSWHDKMKPRLPANSELVLADSPGAYMATLVERAEEFDVIVVDADERRACAEAALKKLRRGGLIILDNSDWHHDSAAVLRNASLIEVDLAGFTPINNYTTTTSLFFHREFDFPRRHDRQPMHGIGALRYGV
jgi:hypothetical protein